MLYLIGLGLNKDGISKQGMEIAKHAKKVYLENYTVELPYSPGAIEEFVGKRVYIADRDFVESFQIIDEAARVDIALLIYGSPLTATTHIAILEEAKKSKVKVKVIPSASVIDGVAETGLQLYKFGKIASMPKWDKDKNFSPESFVETIQHNLSMKAHTLILIDIGLRFRDALRQLEEASKKNNLNIKELIVCQCLGTERQRIYYADLEKIKELREISPPYCFVVPSKMHFMEKEYLENFRFDKAARKKGKNFKY